MGIVFRQSVKTTFVIATGAALGAFTVWLSTKVIINKQAFGLTRNLANYAVALSQLLLLALNSTMYVYYFTYHNNILKQRVLMTLCLGLPFVLFVLLSLLTVVLKNHLGGLFNISDRTLGMQYVTWIPAYGFLLTLIVILEQYLAIQMKVALAVFMREILLRIFNIVLIILFAYQFISFHALVMGGILIYLIPVALLIALAFKKQGLRLSFSFSALSGAEYKDIFRFTWFHFLTVVAITFFNYLDVTMISIYDPKGLVSVAGYAVAVVIISFLMMPSRALIMASSPMLSAAFKDGDMAQVRTVFYRSSINILIPTIGVAVLLACNLRNATYIIGNGRNYSEVPGIFLILMIGRLTDVATGMNDQVLSITKYYTFSFYASLTGAILLFILLRVLVPQYSVYGAAWSTTISVTAFNIAKFIFVKRKLNVTPFSCSSALVVLAALPALAAGYFFPHFFSEEHHVYVHTFFDAALRSTAIVIVYLLMLLWLKPSPDLQAFIASVKKNRRLF